MIASDVGEASPLIPIAFGRQVCGDLDAAATREWLVADGLGGYAMGTVSGLRTRRYHGLLVVATDPPRGRRLALASLDPELLLGDRRVRLATHEWAGAVVDPRGYMHLASFELVDGVPRWLFSVDDVVVEVEVAMTRGRPAVAVTYRLVRAPAPIGLEVAALCTWRDAHGERYAGGETTVELVADGFVFEGSYRVAGPGFRPGGEWYRGVRYREEANRGLNDREDLWYAGRFAATLQPGERTSVTAWADDLARPPQAAADIVTMARRRARSIAARCQPVEAVDSSLAVAADQFIVDGPAVVAGYPWFGDWSRDTMTAYEGLFLETGRWDEGRELLSHAASSLSEGMLANTADTGTTEYNTVDAALWFIHAVGRHVDITGDLELASELAVSLEGIVDHHVAGTRYGIRVDPADGLLTQGAPGVALTWMDARIDGQAVTPRIGKAVEVNALWIDALGTLAELDGRLGRDAAVVDRLRAGAATSFVRRFAHHDGLNDVVDGPTGNDPSLRPNQLLAVSLPHAPLRDLRVVRACAPLITSVGLRSLAPTHPEYRPTHRGDAAARDHAYHQGTVWPWLLGPYVDALLRCGEPTDGVLDGLVGHLGDFGLGSVSETADGGLPHAATGCPFQAWSVAELLRARRAARRAGDHE